MDVHQKRDVVENPSNNGPINSSSVNENLHHVDDEYYEQVSKYLPGFRFQPKDEDLVDFYLKKKVANEQLPSNVVNDVELYKFNPEHLAEKYSPQGDKQWYFFTPRDRKYPNGERPNRAAGGGYWKATGADKPVVSNGDNNIHGFRKALVFYQGKPPHGVKTDWIMHEYRLNQPSKRKRIANNDMRLDDWVLCRIYKKANRNPLKNERKVEDDHHGDPATLITLSSSDQDHNNNAYDHRYIHDNPNFMEQPPTLPPPTYFQHHDPGLAMDENDFKIMSSSSTYHSAGIKSEDYTSINGYHYQHHDDASMFYTYAIPSNMDNSLDHSVMEMDNTDNVINSFTYGNDFYKSQ